jgi:Phytanoyl-CoA dioxygenase (PhyH)
MKVAGGHHFWAKMKPANHPVGNANGLSARQVLEFEETGLLQVPGAIPRSDAQAMYQGLWDEIERKYRFRRGAPQTWESGQIHGLQASERAGEFAAMASPAVCSALDSIFAPDRWELPPQWGQPLVTLPAERSEWNIPHRNWHIDVGASNITAPFDIVIVFALLDEVQPRSGGTVVVSGSHQLVRKLAQTADDPSAIRSADASRLLARAHPWLSELWSYQRGTDEIPRFMEGGVALAGVTLKVTELTGAQGDVIIMHPCVLHTAAKNCGSQPRVVLRQGIFRAASLSR